MKRWIALLMTAVVSLTAWALPTVEQVQAEVAKGNYAAAEVMMRDVIAERPDSARAHYVLAQVLAHNGRLDDARESAQRARQLDPAISFTSRQGFEDFERALARGGRPGAAPPAGTVSERTSVPPPDLAAPPPAPVLPGWAWGVGGAVAGLLLWRLVSRRRGVAAVGPGAAWGGRAAAQGVGAAPATRSGMLGAGLAGAGGFAAGMLAERLLRGDGGHDDAAPAGHLADAGDELSRRSIDFGTGGNDWSSDGGGSSSSDGGGGGGDW